MGIIVILPDSGDDFYNTRDNYHSAAPEHSDF